MSHFPCPLSPFELLMWLDDSAAYPMAFPIIGELTGDVDRILAQQALEAVCDRHPLLGARVAELHGRPHWIATPSGASKSNPIVWRDDGEVAQQRLDLRNESGVRVEFIRTNHRWRMAWHFHHSCCDGVGAATAIGEWLMIYDAMTNGRDWRPDLETIEEQAFARRARVRSRRDRATRTGRSRENRSQTDHANDSRASRKMKPPERVSWWRRLRGVWSHASQALRVVMTTPAELAPVVASKVATDTNAAGLPAAMTVVRIRHWDAEQLAALRRAAEARGARVNDFLLTALMIVTGSWNQRYANGQKTRPIRVMMPTNQRVAEDRGLSAANVVSYAMLDRHISDQLAPVDLLESVRRETAAIARHNLSGRFLISLGVAGRWPRIIRYALQRRGSWSTAVLSNLGEVSRRARRKHRWEDDRLVAGGLRLEAFYGAPQLRPGTRVTVGASIFRDRLTVAAFLDPRFFSASDHEEFLDQFLAALAELIR